MSSEAVVCVRHHVQSQIDHLLPPALKRRRMLALSVLAHAMMVEPDVLDDRVHDQLQEALAHGR